jgi:hypothetical protein
MGPLAVQHGDSRVVASLIGGAPHQTLLVEVPRSYEVNFFVLFLVVFPHHTFLVVFAHHIRGLLASLLVLCVRVSLMKATISSSPLGF